MTILFLVIMALLFKYSTIERWQLWSALIIGLLAQCGYQFRIFGMIIILAIAKVLNDLVEAGRRFGEK
jgi:hypothetical protein